METQLRKKERQNRNLEEEISEGRQKLSDEREAVRDMKVSFYAHFIAKHS